MAARLRPWIGTLVEREVEDALDFWAEDAERRTNIESSQQLESMFEDDGTNLRVKVFMNLDQQPFAQILEFTQTEEDEPIQAVVSDSENSIKVTLSNVISATFKARNKHPVTRKTEGGLFFIKSFDIVVPQFSTADEDPVYLLLTAADFRGYAGSSTVGQPKPIQARPKTQKLLDRFHNVKPEDAKIDHLAMQTDSDDDVASQGPLEKDEVSQFGTQMPASQLPVLFRSNGQDSKPIRTEQPRGANPIETVEHTNVQKPQQSKSNDLFPLLKLLGSRGKTAAAEKSHMPPPAPPRSPPEPVRSLQPFSGGSGQSTEDQVQESDRRHDRRKEISLADILCGDLDEDVPVLVDEDDDIQQRIGAGVQGREANESSSTEKKVPPKEAAHAAHTSLVLEDSHNPNTTPTSYEVPVASSSTVPTTNSNIPSVVPTVEKDVMATSSRKKKGRFTYHPDWKCMLPTTRSACRIPQDQAEILKKTNSVLPPPIGQRFPVGNVPSAVLASLSALGEERRREVRVVQEQEQDVVREGSTGNADVTRPSPGLELVDATGDVLSSQPQPATPDSWSSSPIIPTKRLGDLPPDSSWSEAQNLDETGGEPEISRQEVTELSSSPPIISSPNVISDDLVNDGSDLEMSVPKPLPDTRAANSESASRNLQAQLNVDSESKAGSAAQASRHVSASSQSYTHLHLPASSNPGHFTTSFTAGRLQSVTQPHPSPAREENHISSAPVVPCSYEVSKSSQKETEKMVTFDGAAESRMMTLPDQEDALIEQQIHNEMETQSSQSHSLASALTMDCSQPESRLAGGKNTLQQETASVNDSPSHCHLTDLPSKRRTLLPPQSETRKRVKKYHSNFHFSQDEAIPHMSQDPSEYYRTQRRRYFTEGAVAADDSSPLHRRRASGSHAPGLSDSDIDSLKADESHPQDYRTTAHVGDYATGAEPDTAMRGSGKPSDSIPRPPVSSSEDLTMSQANSLSKTKDQILDDDHAPLPITETNEVSQPVSHDPMELDGPVDEQFQIVYSGPAPQSAVNALGRSANGDISVVKEILLPFHPESFQREAQSAPETTAGISRDDGISRSGLPGSNRNTPFESEKVSEDQTKTVNRVSDHEDEQLPVRVEKSLREVQDELQKPSSPRDDERRNSLPKAEAALLEQARNHRINPLILEKQVSIQATNDAGDRHTTSLDDSPQSERARKRIKRAGSYDSTDEMRSSKELRPNLASHGDDTSSSARRSPMESHTQGEADVKALVDHATPSPAKPRSLTTPSASNTAAGESQNTIDKENPPIAQALGARSMSNDAEPADIFSQFCQAYPEYTGDRKHFKNLCRQLDQLRTENRELHRFLWDDYIVRSRIDYKHYTMNCADEGLDPLSWHEYYSSFVNRPKFTKTVMDPATLGNFLTEIGKAPTTGQNPKRKSSLNNVAHIDSHDPFSRGEDGYRSGFSMPPPKRTGVNTTPLGPRRAGKQQQQGLASSPIQQDAKQDPLVSAAAAPPITAPQTVQPPPAIHALPPKPPLPIQGFSAKQSPKPSGAAPSPPPQQPRAPPHSKLPTPSIQQKGPVPSSAPPAKRAAPSDTYTATAPAAKRAATGTPAPPPSSLAGKPQTREKYLSGMPAPPPPDGSSSSSAKDGQQGGGTMFSLFKKRYNKPRPAGAGGSRRAGSVI